jgi:hypothetical protein
LFIAAGVTDIAADSKATFLQQTANGAAWTDISSKLTDSLAGILPDGQNAYPVVLHSYQGRLFVLQEYGDLQISKWSGSAFGNFERIPFPTLPQYMSMINLGENYIIPSYSAFAYVSQPYIPIT